MGTGAKMFVISQIKISVYEKKQLDCLQQTAAKRMHIRPSAIQALHIKKKID